MELRWKNIDKSDEAIVENWLTERDRKMLCMEEKSWKETANDIEDCLKFAKDGQFRNVIGYLDNKPVVAMMFGVEFSGQHLRIYNILVPKKLRRKGIAERSIMDIFSPKNLFKINKTYNKVVTAIVPGNDESLYLFTNLGFRDLIKKEGFIELSKRVSKSMDYAE